MHGAKKISRSLNPAECPSIWICVGRMIPLAFRPCDERRVFETSAGQRDTENGSAEDRFILQMAYVLLLHIESTWVCTHIIYNTSCPNSIQKGYQL